jgi:hypothetical protein
MDDIDAAGLSACRITQMQTFLWRHHPQPPDSLITTAHVAFPPSAPLPFGTRRLQLQPAQHGGSSASVRHRTAILESQLPVFQRTPLLAAPPCAPRPRVLPRLPTIVPRGKRSCHLHFLDESLLILSRKTRVWCVASKIKNLPQHYETTVVRNAPAIALNIKTKINTQRVMVLGSN